jgi:hypothetical protein
MNIISYGIEYDTTILIYHKQYKELLKTLTRKKLPISNEHKVYLSIEKWKPSDRKIVDKDCLFSIEFVFGPYNDTYDFFNGMIVFDKYIKHILTQKRISILDKTFNILTYNSKKIKNNFINCGMTIRSLEPSYGYMNISSVIGVPQITTEHKLSNIISIFEFICTLNSDSESFKILTFPIYESYFNVLEYSFTHSINEDVKAFLLLLCYYIFVTDLLTKYKFKYSKAAFLFKCRTNIRSIGDMLNIDIGFVLEFLKWLSKKNRDIEQSIRRARISYENPLSGFADLSRSPSIIHANQLPNTTKINVFKPEWLDIGTLDKYKPLLPTISMNETIERRGVIDFGEWAMTRNKQHIFLEHRGIWKFAEFMNSSENNFRYVTHKNLVRVVDMYLNFMEEKNI